MTDELLPQVRRGPVTKAVRRVVAALASAGGRHRKGRAATVDGVPLVVLPDVFDPEAFRSGVLLARAVTAEVRPGTTVLDLGTGSGVGAVFAARAGATGVAVDVNPAAVRCARVNLALHGHVGWEALEGDLFAPVAGRVFHHVLFNPPFFRGRPTSAWEKAWRSEDVLERFRAGLDDVLASDGTALLALSTDGACEDLVRGLLTDGWRLSVAARQRWPGEVATVYRVSRS